MVSAPHDYSKLQILSGAKNPVLPDLVRATGGERILRSAQNDRTARLSMAKLLWSPTQNGSGGGHDRVGWVRSDGNSLSRITQPRDGAPASLAIRSGRPSSQSVNIARCSAAVPQRCQ